MNTVRYDATRHTVHKTSTDRLKIDNEIRWYRALDGEAASLVPKLISCSPDGYEIAYVPYPTIAAWGDRLDIEALLEALDTCLLSLSRPVQVSAAVAQYTAREMYVEKMTIRLAATAVASRIGHVEQVNGSPVPRLSDMPVLVDRLAPLIHSAPGRFGRIHGDLCFGNILYDGGDRLWLIDPRGSFGHLVGCLGDRAYDLAKLSHSMLGGYDAIAADRYCLIVDGSSATLRIDTPKPDDRYRRWLEKQAATLDLRLADIRLLEAVCFLSLAALHTESPDRQAAFMVRGLEIAGEVMGWQR